MTAQEYGAKLMAEVCSVGLGELLRDVRLQHDPSPSYFALQALDRLLHAFSPPTSTTSTLPVLELASPGPGSATTHLLYHLTALVLLERKASVAIIDADATFSVPRLKQQLHLLSSPPNPSSEPEHDATVEAALKHVHIFRPQSAHSLLSTLQSLPEYFLSGNHGSLDCAVGFVALDSASAFEWQMRAAAEDHVATVPSERAGSGGPTTPAALAAALAHASRALQAPLVLISHALSPVPHSTAPQHDTHIRSLRSPLPAPLSALVTLRLLPQRASVRKFAPRLSVKEALREVGEREKAVREAGWVCVVDEWGMEPRRLEKVRKEGWVEGLRFWVEESGVVFESGKDGRGGGEMGS